MKKRARPARSAHDRNRHVRFHTKPRLQEKPRNMAPFDGFFTTNEVPLAPHEIQTGEISFAKPLPSAGAPYEIYNGGFETAKSRGVCIRIANGTAGQVGFIRAWADKFIQYMVEKGEEPFLIAWYLGDSTESLALLSAGDVDIALTYVPAAEIQLLRSGAVSARKYAFRDRFALVGPLINPAGLHQTDSIETMFNKIATNGEADVNCPPNPDVRPATRFLSRCDKSATNIKESQIFLSIGQLPWGHNYSRWYHQYVCFPREAIRAACALSEYTLIDYGAWISAPQSVRKDLKVFKIGTDAAEDVLINPAHLLYRGVQASRMVPQEHEVLCRVFYDWVLDPEGGLQVTLNFAKEGSVLYSKAP